MLASWGRDGRRLLRNFVKGETVVQRRPKRGVKGDLPTRKKKIGVTCGKL